MSNPRTGAAAALFCAGAVIEGASVFVLWYFTAEWSDYLFIVLFCLAWVLVVLAGATWIMGQFSDTKTPPDKGDQVT